MATTFQATTAEPRLKSRYDHIFFPGIGTFILLVVFLGFAQSYYLQGVVKLPAWKAFAAPPHPLTVHIHAVMFSSWILFLVAQTSLVAVGRVDMHRRLRRLNWLNPQRGTRHGHKKMNRGHEQDLLEFMRLKHQSHGLKNRHLG